MKDIQDIENTLKPLILADKIQDKITEMADKLSNKFKDLCPLVICTLKGSMFFYTDLIRAMDIDIKCDFVKVSSYLGSTAAKRDVHLDTDITAKIKDEHIILVDEIVDNGKTLKYLRNLVKAKQPKSLHQVVLLSKPDSNIEELGIDLVGFKIKNVFVVGYGMDYRGYFRNLPYIATSDLLK